MAFGSVEGHDFSLQHAARCHQFHSADKVMGVDVGKKKRSYPVRSTCVCIDLYNIITIYIYMCPVYT